MTTLIFKNLNTGETRKVEVREWCSFAYGIMARTENGWEQIYDTHSEEVCWGIR